jgi:hypothetical protein
MPGRSRKRSIQAAKGVSRSIRPVSTRSAISQTVTVLRKIVPPLCQQPSIRPRVEARSRSSPLSSQRTIWVSSRRRSVTERLLDPFRHRVRREGWLEQVNVLCQPYRSAMRSEQGSGACILLKKLTHSHGNSFSFVAVGYRSLSPLVTTQFSLSSVGAFAAGHPGRLRSRR